ncbi:TonB family protein [Coleofasciculus sp. E2-BRE-01]|uniref:TonB family protein n=1 Tax=Coleofasciculus sp. E2-BRE-01 TaxID=3069524 RepID=UPI0032F1551B
MSISSFCIEQHKKEQEALKKFLIYSFAGSAVLHIVLALGISWAWETRPELAEDPIEIILVEEPEVPKPEEQPLKETPKPKAKTVETLTPPQPTKTQIPEPIKPQQRADALPQKPVQQPVPALPATPQKPVTPPAPTSVEPPTEPTRERSPVVTPPSEPVREPSEPALSPPEPVAINNSAPPRPENNSQPLQTDSDVGKLRERLSEPTTTQSTAPPNDDASEANPTSPGAVATNPSAPPRPRGVSGILSDASKITENIRDRLGGSFSESTGSPSAEDSMADPGLPGAVATNPSAPTRPSGTSQPLSGSSSGSQPFRESLGGGSSGERASSSEGDSIANPGLPGAVATNTSAPTRPKPGGNAGGDRTEDGGGGLRCIRGCNPDYPSSLEGEEGRVPVNVELDRNGNVVNARASGGTRSRQFVQEAEAATRRMKFTKPEGRDRVTVTVNINFTQPGSEFDRQARERREQNERERQQREQERQAQLEQERQERERQAQLEQERKEQERQEQLERERQEQLERERQEQERQEQLERERQEQERQEQLERERQEQERQEQLERERQEQERQEQLERERQEQVEEVPPPEPTE